MDKNLFPTVDLVLKLGSGLDCSVFVPRTWYSSLIKVWWNILQMFLWKYFCSRAFIGWKNFSFKSLISQFSWSQISDPLSSSSLVSVWFFFFFFSLLFITFLFPGRWQPFFFLFSLHFVSVIESTLILLRSSASFHRRFLSDTNFDAHYFWTGAVLVPSTTSSLCPNKSVSGGETGSQ